MEAIRQFFEQLGWLANLAEVVGFFILLLTLANTYILRTEQHERNRKITVLLEVEGQPSRSYTVPGSIRRKDFSRAEIMGRLGMIPLKDKNEKFFKLGYVQRNPKFLEDIERIYDSKLDAIITIPCSPSEFDQFDFGYERRK